MSENKPHSGTALRILHVIANMSAETGGPPVVCAGLAASLAARGHQVAVATLAEPGQTPVPLDPAVCLHALAPDAPDSRYAHSRALDGWLGANIRAFDIVHLHSIWQFPTFAAARACWSAGKPYVVLLNGMLDRYSVHQRSYWLKRAYWLFRERRVEGRAAALHCLNRAEIRRAVPWIAGMPKFILGNGIDAGQLAALPRRGQFRSARPDLADRPLILFLSRMHPKKGLDRLIPAWRAVAEKMPETRLIVAGSGDPAYVASLQKLASDHHLQGRILFAGQLVGAEKWRALADADLFVLPSHQEGFSMAITEALAAGCPPVVTEECNFDELSPPAPEPACGVVIKNGDMAAFTQAVLALLADPARRAALAAAGRQLVASRYTWQTIAESLERNYRQILAGARFPPSP